MPKVSVIVVTHDSRRHIPRLASGLERVAAEVVVVDNGSHDGTADEVHRLLPQAKVIEQDNLGFGAGNNRGAAAATGDVFVFLNPDAFAHAGAVDALAAAAIPGTIAAARIVLAGDPGRLNTCGHGLHFTGYGFTLGHGRLAQECRPGDLVPGFSGACFAMARKDFEQLGGFDEDFFLYMEDTELSWRARRHGIQVRIADAVVEHEYTFRLTPDKLAFLETGRHLILRKHLRRWDWILYAPSLLVAEAVAWAAALGQGRAGLRAKWRALRSAWRRGIHRPTPGGPGPRAFAARSLPFPEWVPGRLGGVVGGVANGVFLLNTLRWRRRS